jgi:hypothetical protein
VPVKKPAIPARVGRPCRKCKSTDTFIEGAPPGAAFQVCRACKNRLHVCGAQRQNRDRGECCHKIPLDGRDRCKQHGGASPGRPIIHGRRSKYLPARLLERVEDGLNDTNLISLGEDVALMDALISEECENLGEDKPAELWKKARTLFAVYSGKKDDDDPKERAAGTAAYWELKETLENGNGIYERIARIVTLTEQKRKLSESELKRLVAAKQFVSVQELTIFVARLQALISETVKEPSERAKLAAGIIGMFRDSTRAGNQENRPE